MRFFKFIVEDCSLRILFQKIIQPPRLLFGITDQFFTDIGTGSFAEFGHIQPQELLFLIAVEIMNRLPDDFSFTGSGRSEEEKDRRPVRIADSQIPVTELLRNGVDHMILPDDP